MLHSNDETAWHDHWTGVASSVLHVFFFIAHTEQTFQMLTHFFPLAWGATKYAMICVDEP